MKRATPLDWFLVVLALVALLAVGGGLYFRQNTATLVGAAILWIAYCVVVIRNYLSGRPVQARGAVVSRQNGLTRYAQAYLAQGVVGLLFGVRLIFAWLAP